MEAHEAGLVLKGFSIPLRVPFRGVRERTGVLVEGPCGWGEFSPFPGYSTGKEPAWQAAVSSATKPWPAPLRNSVEVHVTIPEVSPERASQMVSASGCSAAKVKVGDDGEEPRVEAVRAALGPRGRLIIDANAGWDFDRARERIRTLGRYGVDLVEQPVASAAEMARLRRVVQVPLAADESMQNADDARMLAKTNAADFLVVKVQNLGGVHKALEAVHDSGLPAIVSSLIETSVGIAAGLALAAALPELPYPCGLGTLGLLRGDVVADSLEPRDGWLEVRRPEPDAEALRRYEGELPEDLPFMPEWKEPTGA